VVNRAENASDALAGKTIVISGNFSVSRDEMKALIEANGGKNSGSVSGKTAFLLAGSKPGPEKIKKAESLGVPILDEEAFRKLLPNGSLPEAPKNEETELTLF
jgi:DNA ligase (NAD+)